MKMADKPIIFALANPTPEILPHEVREVRDDAIIATGRSDYPNQVNNVLGFPYIFRGALDVHASDITLNMKLAATKALAALAKETVPDYISIAYANSDIHYGPEYIIPKLFDRRVLIWEASAVAQAAVEEGVAAVSSEDFDLETTEKNSKQDLGYLIPSCEVCLIKSRDEINGLFSQSGDHEKVIKAAAQLVDLEICKPILLGEKSKIQKIMKELGLDFEYETQNPRKDNSEGTTIR